MAKLFNLRSLAILAAIILFVFILYFSNRPSENQSHHDSLTRAGELPAVKSDSKSNIWMDWMKNDEKSFKLNIDRYTLTNYEPSHQKGLKHILFYTEFFSHKNWMFDAETLGEDRLNAVGCPNTNCIFTNNHKYLDNMLDYDAVIFHGPHIYNRKKVPAARSPHQIYVMASKESPGQFFYDLNRDRSFFNWTMTYRLDSDVQWFYGKTVDKLTGGIVAPAVNVKWREPEDDFHDEEMLQIVKNKTKSAAWFVSHCKTHSRREILVEKLQKFIDVDVYGGCGPLNCPRKSIECDLMLNTTYRFYLAFENALCIDYMTEKLYLNMQHFVIPVVYAGVELSRFLPPKSYIDANSFKNVKDLADYLNHLTENPEEYVKYFWWRKFYEIVPQIDLTSDQLCDFCEKLNEPNFESKRQIYEDIRKWFIEGVCSKPSIHF